jgi:hypothetical protein
LKERRNYISALKGKMNRTLNERSAVDNFSKSKDEEVGKRQ